MNQAALWKEWLFEELATVKAHICIQLGRTNSEIFFPLSSLSLSLSLSTYIYIYIYSKQGKLFDLKTIVRPKAQAESCSLHGTCSLFTIVVASVL